MQPEPAVAKRSRRIDIRSVRWSWEMQTTIPSVPKHGVKVIRDILREVNKGAWTEKEIFGIHMSLEEAVMNAIKHGNQSSRKKSVEVIAKISDSYFYTMITDQGEGFDPRVVPDPTCDENLEKPCGRGLMLMKCYMDRVRFNKRGNQVEMIKRRG